MPELLRDLSAALAPAGESSLRAGPTDLPVGLNAANPGSAASMWPALGQSWVWQSDPRSPVCEGREDTEDHCAG